LVNGRNYVVLSGRKGETGGVAGKLPSTRKVKIQGKIGEEKKKRNHGRSREGGIYLIMQRGDPLTTIPLKGGKRKKQKGRKWT